MRCLLLVAHEVGLRCVRLQDATDAVCLTAAHCRWAEAALMERVVSRANVCTQLGWLYSGDNGGAVRGERSSSSSGGTPNRAE